MIRKFLNKLESLDPIEFSFLLSIFFILTHFQKILKNNPIIFIPLIVVSAIGILFQESRQSKWLWGTLCAIYFLWIRLNWQTIDNHMYLWGYWLLAIFMSLFAKNKTKTLQYSAQYLIAFCMLFAFIQKINPIFLSGDFFYYTLITDKRFFFIGKLVNFNMVNVISENNQMLSEMMSNTKSVILNPGPYILHPLSKILTGYILALEGLLALIFFLPKKRLYQWQHWLLFLFFSVYILLPIRGFAFTLITMGIVLIKKKDVYLKVIYIGFLLYMFSVSDFVVDYLFSAMYPILS